MGHARRPAGDTDPTSFAFAPGLTLGVGWRVGSWDIIGQARAAYFQNPSSIDRQTFFGSLGARGRWFVSPSELTPFLDVGVDFSVLAIDMGGGLGPSAHLGGGLEMWHGHAHRRLSLAVGLDVPTFRVDGGNSSASSWFSSPTALYVVPATVSADFTF